MQQAETPAAEEADDITLQASEGVMLEEVIGGPEAQMPGGSVEQAEVTSPVPLRTILALISVGLAVTIVVMGISLFRKNRSGK